MEILTCIKPGHFEFGVGKMPKMSRGKVIIKIKRVGVCGTDLHAFEGTQPYFEYPRILGHELSGVITEIDDASGYQINDAVTVIPYINCGHCIACRSGKTNCCDTLKVCGVHIDGGMAEYFSIPTNFLFPGQGLSFDELALVEPLAIGAHGVARAKISAGENVLVVGAGPIGLGIMEFSKIAGGEVVAMDMSDSRLEFCKKHLNGVKTINPHFSDVEEQLKEFTGGDMPTVIFDATGNLQAINNSFQYLAHGGRYVLVGLQKGNISFSHPEFHKREATLMSSRNATRKDFEMVASCLKEKKIYPGSFITHRSAFSQVKNDFTTWLDPNEGVIKAIIEVN
ncbi:zinc-binding alcohol dehydrogenase family protein [soil metagenome]